MTEAAPGGGGARAGIYVHVPYCRHRCHFCAFPVTVHRDTLPLWSAGLADEIEARAPRWDDRVYDSVYFGGGTPSYVPPATLLAVLDRIRERLRVAPDAEVTVEANPDPLDPGELRCLRKGGVNRLSLGVQSFDDEALRFLTRDHTGADGVAAIRAAREAGFENLTVDLLYGLPDRPPERLHADLDRLAELAPDHVSAYQLTIEPGTPFFARRRRGALVPIDPDREADLFHLVGERLSRAGFTRYEVSSFSREDRFRSRHNESYWTGAPYLGLGPSAHSFRDPVRRWNLARVQAWHAALAEGRSPEAEREELDGEARALERLFLGLRTTRGVRLADFPGLVREGSPAAELTARLVEEGRAVLTPDTLRLTERGLAVADAVAAALAPESRTSVSETDVLHSRGRRGRA